jgi:hypothetical protein
MPSVFLAMMARTLSRACESDSGEHAARRELFPLFHRVSW